MHSQDKRGGTVRGQDEIIALCGFGNESCIGNSFGLGGRCVQH